MSLINSSYFIGDLNIPNTGNTAVAELLNWHIEKYEPEFLQTILGYPMYKAFNAGMQTDPVDQRWLDLLQGKEYTDIDGQLNNWRGLITQPANLLTTIDAANSINIVVGRGKQYDPVAGTNSVLIPAELIGKTFIIERRAIGELRPDEYSIDSNNNFVLAGDGKFIEGDTFFYKSSTLISSVSTGSSNKSLIANYIYYWFIRNTVTQTSGLGEVAANAENATVVSPNQKLCSAWNEMVNWLKEMVFFLNANIDTYPEWNNVSKVLDYNGVCYYKDLRWKQFTYINPFGI